MNVNGRTADHPIDLLFLERWSPRAFVPEPMPPETFPTTLQAARWAASSFEAQPWQFIYALRHTSLELVAASLGPLQSGVGEACIGSRLRGFEDHIPIPEQRRGTPFPNTLLRYRSSVRLYGARRPQVGLACAWQELDLTTSTRTVLCNPDDFALEAVFAPRPQGRYIAAGRSVAIQRSPSDHIPLPRSRLKVT